MTLATAVHHLTNADTALAHAITALRELNNPWADARVDELLKVSDTLGDSITPITDIHDLLEHHGTATTTHWGTRQHQTEATG